MNANIVAVGVNDWDLRFFENQYPVPQGISYNSYIVAGDERTAVLDAMDIRCVDRWMAQVKSALPEGRCPDYLVVHHMEPDHSAGIARFMLEFPKARIVASRAAINMLAQFFPDGNFADRTLAVSDGSTLELGGGDSLRFLSAPMVHWPEVMVSFHSGSGTLFSADAFGSFGCVSDGSDRWPDEARRYYANIVGKYGDQVQSLLKKVAALPVSTVAPLHGAVLDGDLSRYVCLYDRWSRWQPEVPDGVLVAFTSIYGGTAEAAGMIADLLQRRGLPVVVADLLHTDMSEAVSQAFRMGRLVLCSITYEGGVMAPMRDFLSRLASKGLRDRRIGLIQNGSWAPAAANIMRDSLASCKGMTFAEPVVTIKSRLNAAVRAQIVDLAGAM